MNKVSKILATGVLLGAAVTSNVHASEENRARECFEPYQTKIEQLLLENQFTKEQESMFLYGYDAAHGKDNKERDLSKETLRLGTTKLVKESLKLSDNIHIAYENFDQGVNKCLNNLNYKSAGQILESTEIKLENGLKRSLGATIFLNHSPSRDYYSDVKGLPSRNEIMNMGRKILDLETKVLQTVDHTYHQ